MNSGARLPPIFMLDRADLALRNSLKRPEASPLIAHHRIEDRLWKAAQDAARTFINGKHSRIAHVFERWPAVAIALVARTLQEDYGDGGDLHVYAHIAACFRVGADIPFQYRHPLNTAYRRACQRLGLSLPPLETRARLVDDYLVQAGVAWPQLEHLAAAFLKTEKVFGPAPEGSTAALNDWVLEAIDRFLPSGLRVIRRVLEADRTAYHAAVFARLRTGREDWSDSFAEAFNKAIAEAIAHEHAGKHESPLTQRPRVTFYDGQLTLETLPGATGGYVVSTGVRRRLGRGESVPLPLPWPKVVNWESADGNVKELIPVFQDSSSFLVFDADSGRRRAIGKWEPGAKWHVRAGQVAVLARTAFSADDEKAYELANECYVLYVDLDREIRLTSECGELSIRPVREPRLSFDGQRVARCQNGTWLVAGSQRVLIDLPFENCAANDFVVHATHPALEGSRELVIEPTESGSFQAILPDELTRAGPFGRLDVALMLHGSQRPLVREQTWIWPGLRNFDQGRVFDAPEIPEAWDEDASRYVIRANTGQLALLHQLNRPYLWATVVFGVDRSQVAFRIPAPDVTAALRSPTGEERILERGETIAPSSDDPSYLIIRVPGGDARLDVLGRIESRPFDRFGQRIIPLAVLAHGGNHERIDVWPHGDQALAFTLVRIVPTAAPKTFQVGGGQMAPQIRVRFHQPVRGIRLRVFERLCQRECDFQLSRETKEKKYDIGITVLNWPNNSDEDVVIRWQVDDLSPDIRLLELRVAFDDSIWKRPINTRGDCYVVGVCNATSERIADWVGLGEARERLFESLSRDLAACYAAECWPSIENSVQRAWRQLADRFRRTQQGREILLGSSGVAPPADASPTWIPFCHPIEICPDLYELPPSAFRRLETSDADGIAHLGWLGRITDDCEIHEACGRIKITMTFLLGFENIAEVYSNATLQLQNFSFGRFADALESVEENDPKGTFWTPKQERLNRAHHAWCCARAAERLRIIDAAATTNRRRMPMAMSLVNATCLAIQPEALDTPDHLAEEAELIAKLPRFLSALARFSRHKDSYTFWDLVKNSSPLSEGELRQSAGFLIRLAPELFAFYLLLWELAARGRKPCPNSTH